ncbi:putative Reticulon-4 [Hypsibius exemplaris]|uniref:Reticulon-like protein n=1 Tax=Hypsibius exemplaris TaxID=2072580 RepID=A0A1W0XFL1_HYPEX|nr:putative Reticulon-4 [Hypsibius exemplaris]
MEQHHDYELNPDAPPFNPSPNFQQSDEMAFQQKFGDQSPQNRFLIEQPGNLQYNERMDYNSNDNNPAVLRSDQQRLINQGETQVRNAPASMMEQQQPMNDYVDRDRMDSYGNDSLLQLTGEELAQREREIFGEHYWNGQQQRQPEQEPSMAPAMDALGPSFIPREIPDQATIRRRRAVSHYIRDLVMWQNVKDSAVIFSFGGFVLFSLAYFSFISVLSYGALTVLLLASALVFARQLIFTLQQRPGSAHPFQRLLELDVVIPPEYAHQQVDMLLQPVNQTLIRMRNVFLADSLGQSLKWALAIYLMTYVGAWFNLLTLAMVVWALAFTVPKFYVTYRAQIDRMLRVMRDRMEDVKRRAAGMLHRAERKGKANGGRVPAAGVKVEKRTIVEKREKIQ